MEEEVSEPGPRRWISCTRTASIIDGVDEKLIGGGGIIIDDDTIGIRGEEFDFGEESTSDGRSRRSPTACIPMY